MVLARDFPKLPLGIVAALMIVAYLRSWLISDELIVNLYGVFVMQFAVPALGILLKPPVNRV